MNEFTINSFEDYLRIVRDELGTKAENGKRARHYFRQRLDQYGVFDKQLFPDLDSIAKWLKYRVFEIKGMT